MKTGCLLLALFLVVGCSKTSSPELSTAGNLTETFETERNPGNPDISSGPFTSRKSSKVVNNPSFVGTDLVAFFQSYDTSVLKAILIPPVEDMMMQSNPDSSNIEYMENKNVELINILSTIHPESYNSNEMNPGDEMIVFAGLLDLYIQLAPLESANLNMAPFPWQCIWSVITGYLDGSGLINQYKLFITEGATWTTVRGFLWQALKRGGGWIIAAGAIYGIVKTCL